MAYTCGACRLPRRPWPQLVIFNMRCLDDDCLGELAVYCNSDESWTLQLSLIMQNAWKEGQRTWMDVLHSRALVLVLQPLTFYAWYMLHLLEW